MDYGAYYLTRHHLSFLNLVLSWDWSSCCFLLFSTPYRVGHSEWPRERLRHSSIVHMKPRIQQSLWLDQEQVSRSFDCSLSLLQVPWKCFSIIDFLLATELRTVPSHLTSFPGKNHCRSKLLLSSTHPTHSYKSTRIEASGINHSTLEESSVWPKICTYLSFPIMYPHIKIFNLNFRCCFPNSKLYLN
jgi:hypothetical protein